MSRSIHRGSLVVWTLTVMAFSRPVGADEGMWLFNALPVEYLQATYGFTPSDSWSEHVMKASVRFNSGGSASFVSPQGLVLTNHHVGADTLQKVSTAENNYYRDGFYARTLDEEIKAPDLELNQLVSIENVTDRVNGAVKPGLPPAEALRARRAVMAEIEKESLAKTGFRSDVVTLYGGGRYHLYRYKKFTDVRLVWAPEAAIAFFGGDADNFEYPRYCLDACLFRVYENDAPARIEHYLKWSAQGAADGELVFVSGNPGRTSRIQTVAALKANRDVRLPDRLDGLRRREILLQQYSLRSQENERRARDDLFGVQNSRKALTGMLQGLQDPQLMARKQAAETQLLGKVAADSKLQAYASAWDTIAETQARRTELQRRSITLSSQLYGIAQTLVWMAREDQKPSSERLREFRDSARESLEQDLFSPAPIYADLETVVLADSMAQFCERRGADDPLVTAVLGGKSPPTRAAEIVGGTQLLQVDFRRELAKGGLKAIEACTDPMIQLVRLVEGEARELRQLSDEIQEIEQQAYARIAEAIFATQGTSNYPDATFTLRLSFGPVKGYEENGRAVPAWTTLGGTFEHEKLHGASGAWQLPPRWHAGRDKLTSATPFNFVCTADIIGGNSGSPVINRQGELVGLIFDGNLQSLIADFVYSEEQSRAVAVHSSAIRETLEKLYGAERIVAELGP